MRMRVFLFNFIEIISSLQQEALLRLCATCMECLLLYHHLSAGCKTRFEQQKVKSLSKFKNQTKKDD
jgi:hypothetical protein